MMRDQHTTDRDRVWVAARDLFERRVQLTVDDVHEIDTLSDIDRDTVQSALNAMVEQGILEKVGSRHNGAYIEFRRPTPDNCDHCGVPLDEGGWYEVSSYDPYNRRFDGPEHFCENCLHDW